MSAQSSGTVTNGPGTGAPGGDADPFCEAFITTLHEWCGTKPVPQPWSNGEPRRPSFNNMYFRNLRPDIVRNMTRETPVIAFMRDGVLRVSRASTLAGLGGALGTLAGAMLGGYNAANGPMWQAMQGRMHNSFVAAKGAMANPPQAWDCYPDGLSRDGRTWLEIKRPNDTVSDFQEKQHQAFRATGGKVELAGCNCPGANCGEGGNGCPDNMGYEPADPL